MPSPSASVRAPRRAGLHRHVHPLHAGAGLTAAFGFFKDASEKRSWVRRLSDPLIGPYATAAELALGWGAAVAAAIAQLAWALGFGHWSALQTTVAVLFAFDIGGGVVVNATRSGGRWWHRDEVTRARQLGFFAAHVHPFLIAWLWPGFSLAEALALYGSMLVSAIVMLWTPLYLKRPVALGLTAVGLVMGATVLRASRGSGVVPVALLRQAHRRTCRSRRLRAAEERREPAALRPPSSTYIIFCVANGAASFWASTTRTTSPLEGRGAVAAGIHRRTRQRPFARSPQVAYLPLPASAASEEEHMVEDHRGRYVVAHIDEIGSLPEKDRTREWKPIRHHFAIGSFGVNLFRSTAAGELLTYPHDETDTGHEELFSSPRARPASRSTETSSTRPRGPSSTSSNRLRSEARGRWKRAAFCSWSAASRARPTACRTGKLEELGPEG